MDQDRRGATGEPGRRAPRADFLFRRRPAERGGRGRRVPRRLRPWAAAAGVSRRHGQARASGQRETLLDVPHYDFNWQTSYRLAEPKLLPAGTRMHCIAHYDNSEDNPNNPNPKATVRWGDQTWNEMMIGYFDIAVPRDSHQR